MTRPDIVCICGSTRFMTDLVRAAQQETLAGRIVVRPECDLKVPDALWPADDLEDIKTRLDALHRAKIDLADEVLIVAPNGYLGESTRAEMTYAVELGKKVRVYDPRADRRTGRAARQARAGGRSSGGRDGR